MLGVDGAVAARPEFFIQFRKVVLEPFETVVVVKIRLEVLHAIKEGTKPTIRFSDASSFDDSTLHFGNERLGQIATRHSDDRELFRQESYLPQMKEGRKQVSLCEIS
jgi:hypothetical protein